MQITVLGSGSAIPFEGRASAGYLVESGGKKMLLDAGFQVVERLAEVSVRPDEIDAVFLSHRHPDHVMGLFHLLFALKHPLYHRKEPIVIFGFSGVGGYLSRFKKILGHWMEPSCGLLVKRGGKGELGQMKWRTFPVCHIPGSVGIRLVSNNQTAVYLGDTHYYENLSGDISESDIVIADNGRANSAEAVSHLHLDEIVQVARNSRVRMVLLSHLYPGSGFPEGENDGNAPLFLTARDRMKIRL